ncbi:UAA transporter family-domain-containing protein [Rhodotorula toruloides]
MAERSGTKRVSLVLHAAGLISIYSLYGVLQEKIMKNSTYGPNNEHFTSSSLLIVFNRLFSIAVGLGILLWKTRQQPEHGGFSQRLRPASPYYAYASVALANFASTTCQYQALRYVSYTTQSLAKTSKMIPVLVVGACIYRKSYLTREWVAGGVILAGCATYLFSSPPTPHGHAAPSATSADTWDGLIGAAYLLGYLFFDGLVSSTQEAVFGKNPSSSDPFGPESPVLDQMIYTNVFAALIAIAASVASTATGSFWPNLELLLTSARLLWDVCVFSAASAVGLIVLLNTIASFGALTSSLIMTIRQFLSILINAAAFNNFSSVSLVGWVGVFWVASGIWIKINKSYDPPKQPKVVFDVGDDTEESRGMLEKEIASPSVSPDPHVADVRPNRAKQIVMQYIVPLAIPVFVAILLAPFFSSSSIAFDKPFDPATLRTVGTDLPVSMGSVAAPVTEGQLGDDQPLADDDGMAGSELDALTSPTNDLPDIITSADAGDSANELTSPEKAEEDALNSAEASEAAELAVAVEGGSWDSQLHDAMSAACKNELVTIPYQTTIRTAFASFPRSGNSYLRSLIERATGYQTSSVYCDRGLERTFHGECNHRLNFFVKTHFPALPPVISPQNTALVNYYKQFDSAVHVVRNPLDAVASWWHLRHAPPTAEGYQNHEAKVELPGGKFGEAQRDDIIDLAKRWRRHTTYWQQAPLLTHTLRYEDLKAQPIPNMMSLLSFLLPDDDLPPLGDIACIAENHENLQAYHSRRSSDFAQWDSYESSLRQEILDIVRRPFCAFGYRRILLDAKGDLPDVQEAMDGYCDLGMADPDYDETRESWGKGD